MKINPLVLFPAEQIRQLEIRLHMAKTHRRVMTLIMASDDVRLVEADRMIRGFEERINELRHELLSVA